MSEPVDGVEHVAENVEAGAAEAVEHVETAATKVWDDLHHSMLVNSVAKTSMVMDVTLTNGDVVKAPVPVVEVELVDETGKHGSRKMTFVTADEQAYALAKYHQGEMVSVVL